jgi:hypothetical protein
VTRSELWNWYWRAWFRPRGLWSYWLFVAVVFFGAQVLWDSFTNSFALQNFMLPLLILLAMFAFFVVFPQLSYKPRERVLKVGPEGIDTTIGTMSGKRKWEDISLVVERPCYFALTVAGGSFLGFCWLRTVNGNAFVIPRRIFGSDSEYFEFARSVRQWHSARALRFPRFAKTRYYADR